MTGRLRAWLEARWYGDARVPFWMRWLSRLYGRLAERRRLRERRQARILPVPVIVVGNISVGGAGKTPVVIALVQALQSAGWQPGVISRGYGGSETGPSALGTDPDPWRYGDEPVLIASRTGVPVVIGRDRSAAGARLLSLHPGVDVIVSDDGLQHYRLARDIEIAIVDGRRRHGNGLLLPAGPLRESRQRLERVDLVLVNGTRGRDEEGFDLLPQTPLPLLTGPPRALSEFAETPIHAVAGIGDPGRFFATLREAGLRIIEHPFPDHHRYRAEDLAFGDDLPVLMTDKDAVKCRRFARPGWYTVPVTATLPEATVKHLLAALASR